MQTFTMGFFRVEGVTCSAALGTETSVATDSVITPLRAQAIVMIQQAFVNIFISLTCILLLGLGILLFGCYLPSQI